MGTRENEIEARVNAATGGEVWTIERYKSASVVIANGKYPVADVHRKHVSTAEFIAAAPADIRYLLARISELEAENTALRTNEGNAIRAYQQRDKWIWKLEEKLNEYHTALTPFAEVGAQVNTCPTYPPEQVVMRVGEAAFTVAHLIAAADVLAVRAEAVTGGGSGKGGISEHGEDSK